MSIDGPIANAENTMPFRSRVLIKPDPEPTETASGLLLVGDPHDGKANPLVWGTVLRVGKGRLRPNGRTEPLEVKPGDRVLYYKLPSQPIEGDDVLTRNTTYAVLIDEGDI